MKNKALLMTNEELNAFVQGVKFAAAIIEDNRARRNTSFNWIEAKKPKTTKKAIAANDARNDEIIYQVSFVNSVLSADSATFKNWLNRYFNNDLWTL